MDLGYAVIDGQKFPLTLVELRNSECQVTFIVPPGPAISGRLTVFGVDGKGCWQGRMISVPARDFETRFRYGMRILWVTNGDDNIDVTTLPGWKT